MKRKLSAVFCAVCVGLAVLSSNAAASPAAIDFSKLPQDGQFNSLLLGFENAYGAIRLRDFQDDRTEEVAAAEGLYGYLRKLKKENYDVRLLRLLVMRCLYNYDKIPAKTVEKEFVKLGKDFPDRAEHHWIYGNYLVSAGSAVDGLQELQTFLLTQEEDGYRHAYSTMLGISFPYKEA